MPIVNIDLAWLNRLLGRDVPPEAMHEHLDQLGCDVEEIVSVQRSRCPRCNALVEHPSGQDDLKVCGVCGFEAETPFERADELPVVRLDLLAARPDLFDVGGLSRALKGALEIETGLPEYPLGDSGLTVRIDPSVHDPSSYRPHLRCAVMTLPPVDDTSLPAIMKLQENLHWGIGRDRKLASIGVYDLDTLEGDITYRTLDPDNEPFTPLGEPDRRMSGRQILEEHPKGIAYAHLLAEHSRYPVLHDSRGQVLSMPPIINSEETKVKVGTRRVFIDVQGIEQAPVIKTLDTLIGSLAELGGKVEAVTMIDGEKTFKSPDLAPRETEVDLAEAKRWLGLPLDGQSLRRALRKMRFDVEPVNGDGADGRFKVRYPTFRTDIRHQVDLLEDLAIGYGYANIEPRLVRSMTVGKPRPEELISETTRLTLLGLGYNEIMSLPLTTEADSYDKLRLPTPERYPRVSNPKLKAYKVVRTHLQAGVLGAFYENRRRPMPLHLFELDNIVLIDDSAETGAAEERRVCFAEMGPEAGYASVRAHVDALLRELGVTARFAAIEHPSFIPGRVARLETDGAVSGVLGELHPEVLERFGLDFPIALAEITLARVIG